MTDTQAIAEAKIIPFPRREANPWFRRGAMAAGSACTAMVFAPIAASLPLIAAADGGGKEGELLAQMVLSTPSVGLIAGGIASGWIMDALGMRRMLLAALLLFTLAGSAGLYLSGAPALIASRFVIGFAAAAITTASDSFIGEAYGAAGRGKVVGGVVAFAALLSVVITNIGGWIADASSWRGPFALYLLIGGGFGLCAWFGVPDNRARQARERGSIFALGRLMPFYGMIAALYVALIMSTTQLSFLLASRGTGSSWVIAVAISVGPLAMISAAWFYGHVAARASPAKVFAFALALLGVGMTAVGLFDDFRIVCAGIALKGVASGLINPFLVQTVLNRATPELRGKALGLMTSAMYVGNFLNPLAVAPLRAQLGFGGAFVAVGCATLLGAAIAAWTSRRAV